MYAGDVSNSSRCISDPHAWREDVGCITNASNPLHYGDLDITTQTRGRRLTLQSLCLDLQSFQSSMGVEHALGLLSSRVDLDDRAHEEGVCVEEGAGEYRHDEIGLWRASNIFYLHVGSTRYGSVDLDLDGRMLARRDLECLFSSNTLLQMFRQCMHRKHSLKPNPRPRLVQ